MSDKKASDNQMTGAAMVVRALKDHGVEHLFGYPGGAVLPIYDEIFQQSDVEHILVRHEQDAGLAGRTRIAFGRMAGALLVPHQNVLDVALLENLVIDRKPVSYTHLTLPTIYSV